MNKPGIKIRLTITAIETYLHSKGWIMVTPSDSAKTNPNVIIYRGGSDVHGKPLTVALPARSDLLGANQRISEVVRLLATLEAKSPRQLALTIASQPSVVQGRGPKVIGLKGSTQPTKAKANKAGQQHKYKLQNAARSST